MDNRFNTIAGWTLAAGIVALGGSIVAGETFHSERPEHMGYPIEGVVQEGDRRMGNQRGCGRCRGRLWAGDGAGQLRPERGGRGGGECGRGSDGGLPGRDADYPARAGQLELEAIVVRVVRWRRAE